MRHLAFCHNRFKKIILMSLEFQQRNELYKTHYCLETGESHLLQEAFPDQLIPTSLPWALRESTACITSPVSQPLARQGSQRTRSVSFPLNTGRHCDLLWSKDPAQVMSPHPQPAPGALHVSTPCPVAVQTAAASLPGDEGPDGAETSCPGNLTSPARPLTPDT